MSEDACLLKPGEQIKAAISADEAIRLVELRYGLAVVSLDELDAYDDRNFRIVCEDRMLCGNPHVSQVAPDGYVLKIVNSLDSRDTGFVEAQNELLAFLAGRGFKCPAPVKQKDGSYYSVEKIGAAGQEKRHVLRLLVFCPGQVLDKVPATAELLRNVGASAARLDEVLQEFSHPGYSGRTSLWSLSSIPRLRDFFFALDDDAERALAEDIVARFETDVLAVVQDLPGGIIHGDLNENNVIVTADGQDVEALIDFGDSLWSRHAFELAICLCYMVCQSGDVGMARHVVGGYESLRRLSPLERRVLKPSVCARMIQSLVLGSYSFQKEPGNSYLMRQHEVKWRLLKKLWPMRDEEVARLWGID